MSGFQLRRSIVDKGGLGKKRLDLNLDTKICVALKVFMLKREVKIPWRIRTGCIS